MSPNRPHEMRPNLKIVAFKKAFRYIYRKIATFGYMEVKRYAVLTYYLHTGYDNTYRGHTKTAIWILSKKKSLQLQKPFDWHI